MNFLGPAVQSQRGNALISWSWWLYYSSSWCLHSLLSLWPSRVSAGPEEHCRVAAPGVAVGRGSRVTGIGKCRKQAGFTLRPSLCLSTPVPQKSGAVLVLWAAALTQVTPKSFPSIPIHPPAGQLHLDVPQPWTWSSSEIITRIILHHA